MLSCQLTSFFVCQLTNIIVNYFGCLLNCGAGKPPLRGRVSLSSALQRRRPVLGRDERRQEVLGRDERRLEVLGRGRRQLEVLQIGGRAILLSVKLDS